MTTAKELLMREPAMAMLMGALPQGEQFGFGGYYDYGFGRGGHSGSHSSGQRRRHHHHQQQQQQQQQQQDQQPSPPPPPPPPPQYDDDNGYGYGFGIGYPMHPGMTHPAYRHHAIHAAHMAHHWMNPASTASRSLLLDPNRDSIVKVERYSFSFSPTQNLVLGTASNIPTFTQQPSTSIKGQRVVMNAPVPGFVLVSSLQIANVNVLVGGTEDAFTYSAGAQGVMLDLPRLDPQNRATSAGAYTGVLPSGYTQGNSFQFIITLQGPSTLAGGYGQ